MATYPFVNGDCSNIPRYRSGRSCQMPGLANELLMLITTYLNITINVVKTSRTAVPGWSNTFDEIYNNETDTYALLFSEHSKSYANKFDFTKEVFSVCFFL